MFAGRLEEALAHYALAKEIDRDHRGRYLTTLGTEVLVLGYGGQSEVADARATAMLDEVGDDEGPHAAFAWYAAGEADLSGDLDRARRRFSRALELADATGNAFVSGVAGTSDASIDLRRGDFTRAAVRYRALLGHWRRAGVWSTQWTTLRSVAQVLEGLGRHREAAILAGAVFATDEGHDIYGDDAVALQALQDRLRATLGAEAHRSLLAEGAELDGDAAVELVLRSL
jgi:tetratricopeptide (TPR) repeat protein